MKKSDAHKAKQKADAKTQGEAPDTVDSAPPRTKAGLEALEAKVAELEQANAQLREQYLRLQADYANHQKRTVKRIADDVEREKRTLLNALLPSLDNFPPALAHAEAAKDAGPQAVEGLVEGIRRVFQHMLDALAAQGLVRIETAGKPFDPTVHEALMQRCEPDQPDGTVLEEVQAGYLLNGRLLRPAKVIVNKAAAKAASEMPDADAGSGEAETGNPTTES